MRVDFGASGLRESLERLSWSTMNWSMGFAFWGSDSVCGGVVRLSGWKDQNARSSSGMNVSGT